MAVVRFPSKMEDYPNEWIALTLKDPPQFLGHGKTPEEAIRSAKLPMEEIVLYWHSGDTRIRV